ncbi:MAG: CopG family transcriptional regulator [Actinomycetota bacterium]
MEKTTVYLDAGLRAKLQALAKRRSVPQAELIREALAIYLLSQRQRGLPSWVGSVTDGPVTDSSTIKRELRPLWGDYIERKMPKDEG